MIKDEKEFLLVFTYIQKKITIILSCVTLFDLTSILLLRSNSILLVCREMLSDTKRLLISSGEISDTVACWTPLQL